MIQNKRRSSENQKGQDGPASKRPYKDFNKSKPNTMRQNSKSFDKGKQSFKPGFKKFDGPRQFDNKAGDKGRQSFKPGFKKYDGNSGKFERKFDNKAGSFKKYDGQPNANGGKFERKFDNKAGGDNQHDASAPPEKTDWAKFKQEKKELKLKRKKSKDIYEISVEAKKMFEKLRCRRTEKKSELVEKLHNLFISGEDTFKKLVVAHDTARIVQCMLKFASPSLREQISEHLLPLSVDMSISKYSHFCVLRMFKYGSPTTKSKLVDSFLGSIVKLASHNISNKILDHVYLTVASAQQKAYMRQEFYSELYKKSKDKNVNCLMDTYKESPGLKSSILGAVKLNLEHMINKNLVDNSLVHAVMLEYIREVEEDKLEETVSLFGPLIPLMLTTKEGCQAAIISFYKSTAKNRRAIIKAIKEHLVKICTHEHGHVFILAVLNSLDDTKAVKKAIFDNVHPELQTLMESQYGRRVIEWFVNPADTHSFHPGFIAVLDEGLQYGKKDKELRRKEIFEQIEEPITSAITTQPDLWVSERHIGLVTAEVLKKISSTYFVQAANALAKIIVNPEWTVNVKDETKDSKPKKGQDIEKIITEATQQMKKKKQKQNKNAEGEENNDVEEDSEEEETQKETKEVENYSTEPGIEEAGFHIVLKKVIKNDKQRTGEETFGAILLQHLEEATLDYWLTVNRACFVLLNILENNNETTAEALKQHIKKKLPLLKKQTSSGAKLLLKKLGL